MRTVTQSPVTPSQPMLSVDTESPARDRKTGEILGGARLDVSRHYPIRNEFGGVGRIAPADCDGMIFPDSDAAFKFARERGYLMDFYYRPRLGRIADAQRQRIERKLKRSRP